MRKFLMGLIAALIAIAVTATLGLAPTFAATGSTGGTTELEISTWSLGAASSNAEITDETRLVIDGATQVSWEVPDHNVTVTSKQLRKAPRIKVNATGANSSKVIFKAAVKKLSKKLSKKEAIKAAGIVILKKGSCVRNTGRENALRVGFVWCLAYDAVLVFDKPSKQYRHAYNIRDGKLIKTCLNYIGGNVPMRAKVVQVRYEEDVEYEGNIMAVAEAKVSVKFSLTCPNGASFQVDGFATAYGRASDRVTFTSRTRVSVENGFKLKAEQNILVNQDVFAAAGAGINIKATCGDNPPPPPVVVPKPTLVEIGLVNRVLIGNDIEISVSGTVAKDHNAELFCTALNGGTVTTGKRQPNLSGSFSTKFGYQAPGEIPDVLKDANGNVVVPAAHDMVKCILTQDDGQTAEIRTEAGPGKFEIFEMPADPA